MVKIKKIQILFGKDCDISSLKGVKFIDFKKQNRISRIVAKEFFNSKNKKIIKECIICGSKKIKSAATVLGINFMQCKRCTHVFNKYYYDNNFLKQFWKKKGDIINVHSHSNQQKYRSNFLSKPKVDLILKHIKNKKNLNWLDLGCGNGEFLLSVKKRGIKPYGFDLNTEDVRLAKTKGLNVFQKNISEFYEYAVSKDIKFDVASATGYFDVVNEPNKELEILNRLIKKGGILMIDLPDFNSVTHEMIRSFPSESIRHLNACQRSSFTLKSLLFLLEQNGYKILTRWVYGLDFYMIMNYLNQKNKYFQNTNAMRIMTKKFSEFQKIFDEEKVSDTLFFIAKKIKG